MSFDKPVHFGLGFGATVGEFFGGTFELEAAFHNVVVQPEVGAGIKGDGNFVLMYGAGLGYRFFLSDKLREWSILPTVYADFATEDSDYDYEYLLMGLKLMVGYLNPISDGVSHGIDVGFRVGYREQLWPLQDSSIGRYDYSGITGGMEARWRLCF